MTSERARPGPPPVGSAPDSSSVVLTLPNAISAARIALIPVFVVLIVGEGTEAAGLVLFAFVAATDWVDGYLARRTGTVSTVGAVLDPVADRLAIGAGLIALVIADLIPLWVALTILVRDALVIAVGLVVLARSRIRIEVRTLGKVATFGLMSAIPMIAWGNLDLPLSPAATATGWVVFAVAIVEYYLATIVYVGDLRAALAAR